MLWTILLPSTKWHKADGSHVAHHMPSVNNTFQTLMTPVTNNSALEPLSVIFRSISDVKDAQNQMTSYFSKNIKPSFLYATDGVLFCIKMKSSYSSKTLMTSDTEEE